MKHIYQIINLLICSILLHSCSTTKMLDNEEYLYKKANIHIDSAVFLKKLSLKQDLKEFIIQEPNNKYLGIIPFQLFMYNLAGKNVPDSGFRHWLQTKAGEPPVVYNEQATAQSMKRMKNYLFSKGYFHASIDTIERPKNKKMKVVYAFKIHTPFTIKNVVYPDSASAITRAIRQTAEKSKIKEGEHYDLAVLKKERQRVDEQLKDKGYFYFRPEYILFKVDSNNAKKEVVIHVTLKKNIPEQAHHAYKINTIHLYPGYSLKKEMNRDDTAVYNDIKIIGESDYIRHKLLTRSVFFKQGEIYTGGDYQRTINKLTGLKIFKFVNIKFNDTIIDETRFLNVDIFLTKALPRTLRLEIQAQTKSNDFTGPGIMVVFNDRNLFRGAENFSIRMNAGFETLLAQDTKGLNSYEAGFNSQLSVPKIIFPFIDLNRFLSPKYTPRTNFKAGFNILDRTGFFTLHNANFSSGYQWKETKTRFHHLTPFSLTYTNVFNTSSAFEKILNENEYIRESFKEQLITSLKYDYTFNDKIKKERAFNYFFNVNVELAGNIAQFAANLLSGGGSSNKLFGIAFSQYARAYLDTRVYVDINKKNKLIYRWYSGAGFPYGNSTALPYTRQFYAGGASSLRGFRFRSVGPGSFAPDKEANFFDQTGDIKLENNLEYRFPIAGVVKGAFFTDAGNVWLSGKKGNSSKQFALDDVLKELAASFGAGVRITPRFFVLRLDIGIPLRKPYLPARQRWVIDKINFSNDRWRRENIVVNIAIGYPF